MAFLKKEEGENEERLLIDLLDDVAGNNIKERIVKKGVHIKMVLVLP